MNDDYLTQDIVKDIYNTKVDLDNISNIAILCPRNEDCKKINQDVLNLLDG